jgi:hypothetical protein
VAVVHVKVADQELRMVQHPPGAQPLQGISYDAPRAGQ